MTFQLCLLQVEKMSDFWSKLKQYIRYQSSRAFSFLVVFLGDYNADGLVMGNGITIPKPAILAKTKEFIAESDEFCPLTVYLAFCDGADKLDMSKIAKEKLGDEPEYIVVKKGWAGH